MAQELAIHDVLIIGAGPSSLALAARLRERTPSALFTDSEHQRYHWMRSSSSNQPKAHRFSRRVHTAPDRLLHGPSPPHHLSIAVLDAHSASWMGAWNTKFEDLGISHLRSPMFFHPDPGSRDGLLSFAYARGREGELREIAGVVGKGLSKHQRKKMGSRRGGRTRAGQEISFLDERERNDYFRPSQKLFRDYCEDVVERYDLGGLVEKAEVRTVTYEKSEREEPGVFTVDTDTGRKMARIVVLAIGGGLKPGIPSDSPFHNLLSSRVTHAFTPPSHKKHNLPSHLLAKIASKKATTLIVVGGGLTSAQIVDTALKAGVAKVYLLLRSKLKVKHFDVDLCWVGKYKNFHMSTFWSADDDEERAEMVRKARGGGSVTPEYRKILGEWEKKGRVCICEETRIVGACTNDFGTWDVETEPSVGELERVDHVVYATGVQLDFNSLPAVQPLLEKEDAKCVGGLPCLTDDLMFREEIPFFVTGRLASLKLGPGAGNLEGARIGAERVAWKVGELVRGWEGVDGDSGYGSPASEESEGEVDRRRLGLGMENQFGVLGIGSESDE